MVGDLTENLVPKFNNLYDQMVQTTQQDNPKGSGKYYVLFYLYAAAVYFKLKFLNIF